MSKANATSGFVKSTTCGGCERSDCAYCVAVEAKFHAATEAKFHAPKRVKAWALVSTPCGYVRHTLLLTEKQLDELTERKYAPNMRGIAIAECSAEMERT